MSTTNQLIRLTPAAVTHIESQLATRSDPWGIKLGIRPTGCSGFAYVIEFFDGVSCQGHTTEKPYMIDGINVAMSDAALLALRGTEIDFITEGLNSGFVFYNPQVQAVCGCGKSFTV